MLRFQQRERKGVYSRKREEHEEKNANEKYQMRLKNKEFKLPGVQKHEEELIGLEVYCSGESGLGWLGKEIDCT